MMFGLPTKKKKRVYLDGEMRRIAELARRSVDMPSAEFTEQVSAMVRVEGSKASLLPVQAKALFEIDQVGGLIAPIPVGGGKTLITLLAPLVANAKKPLLLAPASLIKKTLREIKIYKKDWKVPNIETCSYEKLSRASAAEFLLSGGFDLVILDEAHKVKNKRSSVTRRVLEFKAHSPKTKFITLSGTFTNNSLKDYSHISHMCLGDGSPVPKGQALESWSGVLDAKAESPDEPISVFEHIAGSSEFNEEREKLLRTLHIGSFEQAQKAARELYSLRLLQTIGVVGYIAPSCAASIYLDPVKYELGPRIREALKLLREKNELPGGRDLMSQLEVWTKGQEMALGFYHYWDPEPPFEWRERRKAWARFSRTFLSRSKTIHSPNQLALEIKAGRVECAEYFQWKKIEKDFTPITHSDWLSDEAIKAVLEDCKKDQTLIWCASKTFAKRLAEVSGLPWFGAQGLNKNGLMIEDYDGSDSLIVSTKPNLQGRNLQKYNRNLICGIPPTPGDWEQLIGRTHRMGQEADEIQVRILCGSADQVRLFDSVRTQARYVEDTMTYQKILAADDNYPTPEEVHNEDDPIWDCRITEE